MTSIRIGALPPNPGPAAWNEILTPPDPATPLEGHTTADWLVIGAGLAGLAAARRLSLTCPGDRITVLDALRVGEGPAGRNSGFMIDLPHNLTSGNYAGAENADRQQIATNRAAITFALDTAEAYGLPDEAISRSGKINGAASARGLAHNADFARHLARLGEDHESLDAADMREITGTDYYAGGLLTPHAAIIQPALFVRGVAAGLRSNRVAIAEQSPVTALDRIGTDWRATTPNGAVTAPRVILAVNGLIQHFGFFARRLVHVFTYASMTRALTHEETRRLGGHPTWALTPADPMGTTVRRVSGLGGDRIVVRNRFHYASDMTAPRRWDADVARDHDLAFGARFPMLGDVTMEHRWGGRLCLSRNDAPAFGELEPGLFAACCQNGLGTARGTAAGMAAADLATGQPSALARYHTGQPQPTRLPPEPLARLGATARIKWQERMAGPEL